MGLRTVDRSLKVFRSRPFKIALAQDYQTPAELTLRRRCRGVNGFELIGGLVIERLM